MRSPGSANAVSGSNKRAMSSLRPSVPTTLVAIVCWLDLLGYGSEMDNAGFDPAHPLAARPLARLRRFHRLVAKHSSAGFPTLAMNDGAAAYSNVGLVRNDSVWKFIERCWSLYSEASVLDLDNGGIGIRGVIAVGLRAKGSARGIDAQEKELVQIIEDLVAGRVDRAGAIARARRARRLFDIVPPLQANFAFARAYLAEQAGTADGLVGPNLFVDTHVFKCGVPTWMHAGQEIDWTAKRASLSTKFVPVIGFDFVPDHEAHKAFRNGEELKEILRKRD